VAQPLADLRIEVSASADRLMVNDAVRFLLRAANYAPYTVPDVRLEDLLPDGVDLVEAAASQGTTNLVGRSLMAGFGDLPPGAVATLTVLVVPRQLGVITNSGRIQADAADPSNPLLHAEISTLVLRDPPLEFGLVDGKLKVAWPSVALGFELQSTDYLTPPANWQPDLNPVVLDGRRFSVTLKPLTAGRYYRLIKTTP
jgi:uncharacterized repeat protein (TIGR01451 family)